MKVKQVIYGLALAPVLSTSVAYASDGSVAVDGIVAAAACTIPTSYVNATWAAGDISLTAVPAAGDVVSGPKSIAALNLSACAPGITAMYRFDGEPDVDMPELFKVAEGVGQATGVAFKIEVGSAAAGWQQLYPQTNSPFYAAVTQNATTATITGKTLRLSLIATGGKTNFTGSVGGVLDTTMTYTIVYN